VDRRTGESAARVIDDIADRVEQASVEWWRAVPRLLRGRLYLAVGRLDEAGADTQRALHTAERLSARVLVTVACSTLAERARTGCGVGRRSV
jgi:hypothetical protein